MVSSGTVKWFELSDNPEGFSQPAGALVAELRSQGRDEEANAIVGEELRSTIAQSFERAEIESAEVQGDVI